MAKRPGFEGRPTFTTNPEPRATTFFTLFHKAEKREKMKLDVDGIQKAWHSTSVMRTNQITIRHLARNSKTKGYWTGDPAPNSFKGSREDAKPLTETELAVLRYTYEGVESETVELQDA